MMSSHKALPGSGHRLSTTPSFMRPTTASKARYQSGNSTRSSVAPSSPSKTSRSSAVSSPPAASSHSSTTHASTNKTTVEKSGAQANTQKTVLERYLHEINAATVGVPAASDSARAPVKVNDGQDHASKGKKAAPGGRDIGATSTKRKHSDSKVDLVKEATTTTASTAAERATEDREPAKKKRKVLQDKRTTADSDDETMIISKRKPKTVSKKLSLSKGPALDVPDRSWDRDCQREQEKLALAASKGKLATGKFIRSYNDTKAAARMSRSRTPASHYEIYEDELPAPRELNRDHLEEDHTVAQNMGPSLVNVARMSQPAHLQKLQSVEKRQKVQKTKETYAAQETHEVQTPSGSANEGPSVKIVDLTKVKFLRTGANGSVTASLQNVLSTPEMYPNIEVILGPGGKPAQARVMKFDSEKWAEMLKASKARAQKHRRQAAQEARKVAKQAGGKTMTGRVTKANNISAKMRRIINKF